MTSSVRRAEGFVRYAVAVQYHGANFLGFTYQGAQEIELGYPSVEGRLRTSLSEMFVYENIQVSSRTDRGVHALRNTFHVDIQQDSDDESKTKEVLNKLRRGLNFHLARQTDQWHRHPHQQLDDDDDDDEEEGKKREASSLSYNGQSRKRGRYSFDNELRILSAARAPDYMINDFVSQDPSQPPMVDWNARFSATQRIYVYRILSFRNLDGHWGVPFEWDRSWSIRIGDSNNAVGDTASNNRQHGMMDVNAMQKAANHLVGTHDFSTFRGSGCQRQSPIVTLQSIQIRAQPYGTLMGGIIANTFNDNQYFNDNDYDYDDLSPSLVTIQVVGDAFLYRQVRNLVGCLVEVGKGKLKAEHVKDLLNARDRSMAPTMAPAHGLYLVNVQHGDFHF